MNYYIDIVKLVKGDIYEQFKTSFTDQSLKMVLFCNTSFVAMFAR